MSFTIKKGNKIITKFNSLYNRKINKIPTKLPKVLLAKGHKNLKVRQFQIKALMMDLLLEMF